MVMEKEKLVSLVTAAQNGDNDAMNELFNAFYNDFYYFALKTVKDDELALDITQEAFVEIINTLGNLKEPAAFVTWAKQITYHQCTRYFKKKKDVLVDEDEDGNTIFDTLKEDKAEFIPDEALDKADFKKTILAILDELSEEQRSATMMYYFDEMSVKQIAEIQGVSEGTVKSRLNYARKAIKNSVEVYEKKHNIKLHAIPFFPFFKWIFEGAFDGGMPIASAELVAEGVTTATGTAITVSATTGTTAAVATTTTATAVGIGAKIAAMPLVTKIVAGIVAATIVIGGTTTAVLLSNDNNDDIPAGNQSIVSTNNGTTSTSSDTTTSDTNTNTSSESSSTDTTTSDGTSSTESSATNSNSSTNSTTDNSSTNSTTNNTSSEKTPTDAEMLESLKTKFAGMSNTIKFSALPYFESTDKLAPSSAFWYTLYGLDNIDQYKGSAVGAETVYVIPISDIDKASQSNFGRTYDYSAISNEGDPYVGMYTATYVPKSETEPAVMFITVGGGGGDPGSPEGREFIKIDDTTYQVNISWYEPSSEKPDDTVKDWYQSEDDPSTYLIAYRWEKMILKYVDGNWQMVSYLKA